jgi:hypothetical protein
MSLKIEENKRERPFDEQFGASGIVDAEDPSKAVVLLMPIDYPRIFRGHLNPANLYAHPEDFTNCTEPIAPEVFLYKSGIRSRLFLRISIKLAENSFTSATFFMDTGCCSHFMISPKLMSLMKPRLIINDIGDNHIETTVHGKRVKCAIAPMSDERHISANLVGFPLFFLLGIQFNEGKVSSFEFDEDNIARGVVALSSVPYL